MALNVNPSLSSDQSRQETLDAVLAELNQISFRDFQGALKRFHEGALSLVHLNLLMLLRFNGPLTMSRLAEMLDVSRVTVSLTYDQLTAEGYLHARRGSGTFVSSQIPDALGETRHRTPPGTVSQARIRLSKYADRLLEEPARRQVPAGAIDLSCFAPDYERFPMAEWRRTLGRVRRYQGDEDRLAETSAGWPP